MMTQPHCSLCPLPPLKTIVFLYGQNNLCFFYEYNYDMLKMAVFWLLINNKTWLLHTKIPIKCLYIRLQVLQIYAIKLSYKVKTHGLLPVSDSAIWINDSVFNPPLFLTWLVKFETRSRYASLVLFRKFSFQITDITVIDASNIMPITTQFSDTDHNL